MYKQTVLSFVTGPGGPSENFSLRMTHKQKKGDKHRPLHRPPSKPCQIWFCSPLTGHSSPEPCHERAPSFCWHPTGLQSVGQRPYHSILCGTIATIVPGTPGVGPGIISRKAAGWYPFGPYLSLNGRRHGPRIFPLVVGYGQINRFVILFNSGGLQPPRYPSRYSSFQDGCLR